MTSFSMEAPARQLGATHVISVYPPNPAECVDPGGMFAVVSRGFQVMSARMNNRAQWLIELGEQAALAGLPEIRRWLHALNISAATLKRQIGLAPDSSSTMKAG